MKKQQEQITALQKLVPTGSADHIEPADSMAKQALEALQTDTWANLASAYV